MFYTFDKLLSLQANFLKKDYSYNDRLLSLHYLSSSLQAIFLKRKKGSFLDNRQRQAQRYLQYIK